MNTRLSIAETEPDAFKAMYALVNYLGKSKVSKSHIHLSKIRASQINGCAYCIDMHTKEALKDGETTQRLFLLNAWKETGLFTEEEKVVLAITEEVTLISHNGLTDETYQHAIKLFDEHYIAQLIMAIVAINAWNRISISSQTEVPK